MIFLHTDNNFFFLFMCLVTQSCPTLCNPMECSPPSFSVHGILQTRVLEWVAMPSSRGSSQTRGWTQVSHIAGEFFTDWATREAFLFIGCYIKSGRNSIYCVSRTFLLLQWRKWRHYKNPPKKVISSHVNKRGDYFLNCLGYPWNIVYYLG